jgi:hypothetical protein
MKKFITFNEMFALKLTGFVGSMVCAYIFCFISFISLPATLESKNVINIISWFAQTFLQLVLLSIIMVGQNLQTKSSEEKLNKILQRLINYQKEELREENKIEKLISKG